MTDPIIPWLLTPKKKKQKQFVVCAALRNKKGQIICGPRHFDSIMCGQIKATRLKWNKAEQGFVDQFGKFLNRMEAWYVAYPNGQIVRRCGNDGPKGIGLFSENLY